MQVSRSNGPPVASMHVEDNSEYPIRSCIGPPFDRTKVSASGHLTFLNCTLAWKEQTAVIGPESELQDLQPGVPDTAYVPLEDNCSV
jgi:hypothetical protein